MLRVFSEVTYHHAMTGAVSATDPHLSMREGGGRRGGESLLASLFIYGYAHARNTTRADPQAKSCGQAPNQWYVLFISETRFWFLEMCVGEAILQ